MPLTLYNSLTKSEEVFTPLTSNEVTMYSCGPTVYSRPHIGNYSSFLMADLVRRWLEVSGYTVKHVKNITDVGHLSGDDCADATGEDKMEREAKKGMGDGGSGIGVQDVLAIAEKYTKEYLDDEKALGLLEPLKRPKATEVIGEILAMIQTLIDKGHAYETDDGYYFAVESFEDYGKLSGNTLESLSAGARIEVDEKKRSPHDFALWKKCVGENADHVLRWSFETGDVASGLSEDPSAGFPGWHIECSVMSSALLGETIDIHTGGEDLIFPHHECEIAQSECACGKQFVRYWLHKRFIDMGDIKMSKSLGNVLNIPDILDMGYSPMDLRYLLLSVHYRTNLKFSEKGLDDARKARRRIVEWISEMQNAECRMQNEGDAENQEKQATAFVEKFTDAMNSDLNAPGALAVIFEAMSFTRNEKELCSASKEIFDSFIEMIRHTFGCFDAEQVQIPAEVQALVEERKAAREAKDFEASDRLRDEIATLGYEVRDGGEEQGVRRI